MHSVTERCPPLDNYVVVVLHDFVIYHTKFAGEISRDVTKGNTQTEVKANFKQFQTAKEQFSKERGIVLKWHQEDRLVFHELHPFLVKWFGQYRKIGNSKNGN